MQPIIDADTHVAESEAMWELFADHNRQNFSRPVLGADIRAR